MYCSNIGSGLETKSKKKDIWEIIEKIEYELLLSKYQVMLIFSGVWMVM